MRLRDELPLREEEWRSELDAAEGLTDEEREAAAGVLRRMAKPKLTMVGIRQVIRAMSQAVAPAMRKFARVANQVSQIMGQRIDAIVMDDLTSYRPRSGSDRLDALDWYHAHIHPESLKHLVPAEPVFPPTVEGESVIPGIGRTCMDPRVHHVGAPIWPLGQVAPIPPDQMPAPRTTPGHRQKGTQPSPRRILARAARGRHRKQRR